MYTYVTANPGPVKLIRYHSIQLLCILWGLVSKGGQPRTMLKAILLVTSSEPNLLLFQYCGFNCPYFMIIIMLERSR